MKKTSKIKNLCGLTLLELMAVIMVVGILATMAVAGYKKYMAKAGVARAMAAALPLQQAIQDFYQQQGFMPGANDMSLSSLPAGYAINSLPQPCISNPIQDVSTICYYSPSTTCTVGDTNCDGTGVSQRRQIEITFSNPTSFGTSYLAGMIFILRANLSAGGISWVCRTYDFGSSAVWLDSSLLPNGCVG